MAAVTLIRGEKGFQRIRSMTAQANTGQTDWISVPDHAKTAIVEVTMTASAGTTPVALLHLRSVTPNLIARGLANADKLDDAAAVTLQTATGGLAGNGGYRCSIGPGITAADVLNSTNNSYNNTLPQILGIQLVLDRTTGDETYTYTLDVHWEHD